MNKLSLFTNLIQKSSKIVSLNALRFRKPKLIYNIEIHSSSIFRYSQVRWMPNCSVVVDEQSQIDGTIFFEKENASISIGKRVFMNGILIASSRIIIGDDVLIAWGVTIIDHNAHSVAFSQRAKDVIDWRLGKKDWSSVKIAPVIISSKVWIGFNSIILKGVTIGEGAVIGAGSVVTKNVPAWTIVAGNPACVIREIREDER